MPSVSITFTRDPRAVAVGFLLMGSVIVVSSVWFSLSWHARGMILAGYGITLLLAGLIPALRTRGLLRSGAQAQGAVEGAEKDTSKTRSGTAVTYHPVVRFTTPGGRAVVFRSAVGYDTMPRAGDPVPVRYRPDNPEHAEVDHVTTWVMSAAVGVLGGLGLVVAGVVVFLHG